LALRTPALNPDLPGAHAMPGDVAVDCGFAGRRRGTSADAPVSKGRSVETERPALASFCRPRVWNRLPTQRRRAHCHQFNLQDGTAGELFADRRAIRQNGRALGEALAGRRLPSVGCGQLNQAVEWAANAMDQRIPAFADYRVRSLEPRVRQLAGWPALLAKMNGIDAA